MMNEGGGTYVQNKLPLQFSGTQRGVLNVEQTWAASAQVAGCGLKHH